jgi:putative peptidoglycan lipid II flippase
VNAASVRAWATRSVNARIFADLLTVGGLTSFVKLAGALKVMVTARVFGASDELDAFLIAFAVPSFIAEIAAGSLNPSLIPTLVEVREHRGRPASERLYSGVLFGTPVILLMLAIALAALSGVLLRLLASGFDEDKRRLAQRVFLLLLLWLPASGLIVTWRALLNAWGRFALPAWAPLATPVITIALLFAAGRRWGAYSLVAGTLVGIAVEVALLARGVAQLGFPVAPRWTGWSPDLRQVFRQYVPMVAGALVLGGAAVVDQGMAATLSAGSVSVLSYGSRLVTVLMAIGGAALGAAMLPHLSRMAALEDWTGFRRTARAYTALILGVSIPLTVALMYSSYPLVRLFFERGAFREAAAHAVAFTQICSLAQLPLAALLALALRLVSSVKGNQVLPRVAMTTLVANLAFDYLLMRKLGVAGIALAGAPTHLVSLAALIYFSRRLGPAVRS